MADEDCPLCCEPLTATDQLYALHCPTATCHFNYCVSCIESLKQSAADDYQEASDGSHQVKVTIQCPQCRRKYLAGSDHPRGQDDCVVVNSVLILRRAAAVEQLLQQTDSELCATELSRKHAFLQTTSPEDLQAAVIQLQVYQKDIGKDDKVVPELDWSLWRRHLTARPNKPSSSPSLQEQTGSSNNNNNTSTKPFIDPTLFCGLEELMSRDEQEFVTQLLISGKVELLAQAAHILHGILELAATRTTAVATVQQLSKFSVQDAHMLRRRFPLPARMPRCVSLAVYNPDAKDRTLKFPKNDPDSLALANVRGPAGKVGLRRGDVVTHVNGEAVHSQVEFSSAMLQEYNLDETATVLIVVNADQETADLLRERAATQKKQTLL